MARNQKTKTKNSKWKLVGAIAGAVALLVAIIVGAFCLTKTGKITLDQTSEVGFIRIEADGYEQLLRDKKSALLFIDQSGCHNAAAMAESLKNIMAEHQIGVYRMQFSVMKTTSLHDQVEYYPSLVVINKGKIVNWLKADSNQDTERFRDEQALRDWIAEYVAF